MQSRAKLLIEQRAASTDSFGKGKKVPMSFGDFCKRLQEGDDSLYLSSQQVCFKAVAAIDTIVCFHVKSKCVQACT